MGKSTFGKRLGQIMQDKDMSRGALKDATGISLQSISNYLNDKRKPDCEMVAEIAKTLNVSADYLLGLSEVPTRNETIQGVNDITGLWDDAISKLYVEKITGGREASSFLSFLVLHDDFSRLVASIHQRNRYSGKESLRVDLAGELHDLSMREVYKMLVSDLFFGILDDYTAGPGEIMTGYRKGDNNG